ncbi:F5/8 type C domain-containing protein [Clostridium cavendishii DSM 21758]|uniref:F5/8 type C domain-containing protein n=1 Tax=Clostridium cavendishii DSM 21758 TaxID=1121302 RepID=A0A1M6PLS0_9CLOT|nr:discoidin domain-containing protein [Clostridium cavendishii]SHK08899.1 F5/8 type C domain-containing protein [Clostridium cavendishii DSM 21758]
MKKKISMFIVIIFVSISIFTPFKNVQASPQPVSAIFGGGPFYEKGQSVMNDLKSSGFNTVMIWSIHVSATGDLNINDHEICKNGSYVGSDAWKAQWATLKQAPTSINRIEVSIGAWGTPDFENIRNLINSQGTGPNTNLYKNFKALLEATGADAVDYDDESCYDVDSAVKFGQMCTNMGYKNVTLCPYTNVNFWSNVKNKLGDTVDRVYLQCYAGGSSNNPASWQSALGMKVIPGLWCRDESANSVKNILSDWNKSSGIAGGFMWLYDDMLNNKLSTASYANAINSVFTQTPPYSSDNLALNKSVTANQYVNGENPSLAVDGSTTDNSKWCSTVSGPKWLKIDLGKNYDISRWVVKHAGAGSESSAWNTKDFKLQKSSDGINWTDVDTVVGNNSDITDRKVPTFNSRYLRLYITTPTNTNDSAARIYEFEVYGK